jgi:hypothetical protein
MFPGNPIAYGHGTFPVYWMLNFFGMIALGLACENVAMVIGMPWMGLFLILWVITNVSTAFYDIEILSLGLRVAAAFDCRGKQADSVWVAFKDWTRLWYPDCLGRGQHHFVSWCVLVPAVEDTESST